MDETEKVSPNDDNNKVLESPKPVAFTVDFGETKPFDSQRLKSLHEKFQSRHRRGQSLSKIEAPVVTPVKKPLSGKLPRKSGYHAEGYHSSDEKVEKFKGARSTVLNSVLKKGELTLPLKSCMSNDRMTQSYPRSFELPVIDSPEVEIKDISSPELEPMSPVSPLVNYPKEINSKILKKSSSEDIELEKFESCIDIEKADVLSDAGKLLLTIGNLFIHNLNSICLK